MTKTTQALMEPVRSKTATKQRKSTATTKKTTTTVNGSTTVTKTVTTTTFKKSGATSMSATKSAVAKQTRNSTSFAKGSSSMKQEAVLRSTTSMKQTVKQQQAMRSSTSMKQTVGQTMRTGRSTVIKTQEMSSAPGSYDIKGMSFGEGAKGFTIGVKRESRMENSPGPGDYDKSRSDSVTKTRNPSQVDFSKTTGRVESVSPARESSADFGNQERFYQYPKEVPNFSMGVKRPEKPKDGPGPGEYNLDDSTTKPRTTGYHQF